MGRATEFSNASASAFKIHNLLRDFDILRHQGERFFFAEFLSRSAPTASAFCASQAKVVAAEPFTATILPDCEVLHSALESLRRRRAQFHRPLESNNAVRTRDKRRAARESGGSQDRHIPRRSNRRAAIGHRGIRPIVRQPANHAVARPAVGAVDIRIVIARDLADRKVLADNPRRPASRARFDGGLPFAACFRES